MCTPSPNGLSIASSVFAQHQRVTDGQWDEERASLQRCIALCADRRAIKVARPTAGSRQCNGVVAIIQRLSRSDERASMLSNVITIVGRRRRRRHCATDRRTHSRAGLCVVRRRHITTLSSQSVPAEPQPGFHPALPAS